MMRRRTGVEERRGRGGEGEEEKERRGGGEGEEEEEETWDLVWDHNGGTSSLLRSGSLSH